MQNENAQNAAPVDGNCYAGWRPIDTAPRDGFHVLLYRPQIRFVGYWGGANSGWRHNAPGLDAVHPLPTHWMPLPAMPHNTSRHWAAGEDDE